uniref:MFS transporter n=1 Tax=Herbaspirillum lusitanum TaxID=213312 RepID=UPI0004944799
EPPAAPSSVIAAPPDRSALGNIEVWRVAMAIGILCFPQVSVLTFATIFLHDVGHAGLGLISATMAAIQIGAAVMRVWSGRWTDRHGNRRRYLRACSALSVALYIALGTVAALAPAVWPQWTLAAIALLLVAGGVCASAWHGVAYTELATLAGPRQVGTALGLGNTCVFLVFFLAAQAIPPLLHWQGWPAVWLAIAVVALLVWPLFPPEDRARH